jgi:site-specific recombinase XerD
VTAMVLRSLFECTKSAELLTLFTPDDIAARRFVEFFTANVRNANTRRTYVWAMVEFATWCNQNGLQGVRDIEPVHVGAYVECLQKRLAAPSIKLQLAALRMLFEWLVAGQVLAVNPTSSIRNPKHDVGNRKALMLTAEEARALLDSIDTSVHIGLRDRALITLMIYNFARVDAALKIRIEDVDTQGRRAWIRLHGKDGKRYDLPVHHNLDEYLHAYIEGAGLGHDRNGFLFRTAQGHTGKLSNKPMSQTDAWRMIERRAHAASIRS